MLTKFWSGSIIDRLNIRRIMIGTDIIRAILVAVIPFLTDKKNRHTYISQIELQKLSLNQQHLLILRMLFQRKDENSLTLSEV
ncbi:hypothetical protein [Rossellomorea aquimaris]|uniref:hypothetical protein n=1 Tax=Rossellomorea aquimaris TaxID=189382 RepID=UPI003CF5D5E9